MPLQKTSGNITRPVVGLLIGLLLAVVCAGCSSTYTVGVRTGPGSASPDIDYAQLNEILENVDPVTVIMKNGMTIDVCDVHVRRDTTVYYVASSSVRYVIPTSEMSSIREINPLLGALEGFGFGLLAGGIPGFIIGAIEADGCRGDFCELAIVVYPVIGGLAGGFIGLLVGLTVGDTCTYLLTDDTSEMASGSP